MGGIEGGYAIQETETRKGKIMYQILAILFMLVPALASFGQPNPDTLWTRTYGGSGRDVAFSVQQTADGGYIVAGLLRSRMSARWVERH